MAQQIVTYCDIHLAKGERVLGQTWSLAVTVPGSKARDFEVDACDDCAAPFVALVADLQEHARQVAGPKVAPAAAKTTPATATQTLPLARGERVPCPFCDATSATRDALNKHLRDYHESSLAEVEGTATVDCPVSDCSRKLVSSVGRSAHLRNAHMEWLKANPDWWPKGWSADEQLPA